MVWTAVCLTMPLHKICFIPNNLYQIATDRYLLKRCAPNCAGQSDFFLITTNITASLNTMISHIAQSPHDRSEESKVTQPLF